MRAVCSRLRGNTPRSLSSACLALLCLWHPRGGEGWWQHRGSPGAQHLGQGRGGSQKKKKNQTPKPPFFPRLCAFGCKPPAQPAQFTSSHQCWQDGDQSGSDFSNFLPRQPILLIANETVVYFCIKEKSIFFLKLCLPFPFRPSAWDPFPAVLLQVTQESPRGVTLFLDPWQEGVGGALLSPGIFCFIFCVCVCVSLQGSSSKSL